MFGFLQRLFLTEQIIYRTGISSPVCRSRSKRLCLFLNLCKCQEFIVLPDELSQKSSFVLERDTLNKKYSNICYLKGLKKNFPVVNVL